MFGRAYVQKRKTGSTGINKFTAKRFSPEWAANVMVGSGAFIGFVGVLLELMKITRPISFLDSSSGHIMGFFLFVLGLVIMLHSQLVMGDSWRVGVDSQERNALVTHGIFSIVRNPIYTAGSLITVGFICLLPDPVLIASFAIQSIGLDLQVRNVEEPYLSKVHGARYKRYVANTGRFLPKIRRIKC